MKNNQQRSNYRKITVLLFLTIFTITTVSSQATAISFDQIFGKYIGDKETTPIATKAPIKPAPTDQLVKTKIPIKTTTPKETTTTKIREQTSATEAFSRAEITEIERANAFTGERQGWFDVTHYEVDFGLNGIMRIWLYEEGEVIAELREHSRGVIIRVRETDENPIGLTTVYDRTYYDIEYTYIISDGFGNLDKTEELLRTYEDVKLYWVPDGSPFREPNRTTGEDPFGSITLIAKSPRRG